MAYDDIKGSDVKAIAQAIEKLANRPQPIVYPPPVPVPDTELANAIENGLLTLAESIKYAVDAYVELHRPPEPPRLPNRNRPDSILHEVPWRTARVGDWIVPNGQGITQEDKKQWVGMPVKVSRISSSGVYWLDDAGEEHGGCYNNESRFAVYE